MSNNPILPIVPNGAAPLDDDSADDNEATVEMDLSEGNTVNENLDE